MNNTYARLTGRRAWFVNGISVWGDLAAAAIDAVGSEHNGGTTRVVFYQFTIGGQAQEVAFASLTDHRGNTLPGTIEHPVVTIIPRNAVGVAVVGRPTDTGFRLAKTTASPEDGQVDLWIIEAGN